MQNENPTLSFTHKSGKEITVNLVYMQLNFKKWVYMTCHGATCKLDAANGQKCLRLMNPNPQTKTSVERVFSTKLKSGDIFISMSEADAEWIKLFIDNENKRLQSEADAAFAAYIETCPKKFEKETSIYRGDYSTEYTRCIYEKYQAENGNWMTLKVFNFGEHAPKAFFELCGGADSAELTEEEVSCMKILYSELQANNEAAAKEAEAKEAAAKESAIEHRNALFYTAKETGTKQLISSIFLSGISIPLQFQDEDSDMGHLLEYAMPDGTIKYEFSHSH